MRAAERIPIHRRLKTLIDKLAKRRGILPKAIYAKPASIAEVPHDPQPGIGLGRLQTSAILYTMIESARRHGHEPYAYLRYVLERLPAMKQLEVGLLLPRNWKPAGKPVILNQVA